MADGLSLKSNGGGIVAAGTWRVYIRAARRGGKKWRAPIGVLLVFGSTLSACAPAMVRPTRHDEGVVLVALQRRAAEICCRQRPRCDLPPRPFTTEGCSMWPDGDWGACCIEHDIAYWCGGPAAARRRADDAFRACLDADHGTCLSTMSYLGVRLGGAGWIPVPWRWGYGWDWLEDPR
jgi:hypothetical protein